MGIKSSALQLYHPTVPASSLDSYIHYCNQIPMLSEEEEREYAEKLFFDNDLEAAQKLILPHLRYVVKVARGYLGYGLSLADLIQEGNIGLMKAVKRFDPQVGVRLVTFAVHWIKAEIHEFILKNWRIVKVATTKAQRKLFFNLRKFKNRLGWFKETEINDIANDLGVKPETVREMESRLNAFDASFHAANDDDSSASYAPEDYLAADHQYNPEQNVSTAMEASAANEQLHEALDNLDDRSKDILYHRWLAENKKTLHDLADQYGVSAERIRQIEQAAFKKIKRLIGQAA
ncbi:MAG: RNA polymerase sigma factor RpoH [Gammaproteobacteria bacterium]